jgi:hypothetical protein
MSGKIGFIGDRIGRNKNGHLKLKGNVVLTRKSIASAVIDGVVELAGHHVTCQLISSTVADPSE